MGKVWFVDTEQGRVDIDDNPNVNIDTHNGYFEFELMDGDDKPINVRLWAGNRTLWLGVDGHGCKTSEGDQTSHQLALDAFYVGSPVSDAPPNLSGVIIHIWDDINQEDPTRQINLNGARLANREEG